MPLCGCIERYKECVYADLKMHLGDVFGRLAHHTESRIGECHWIADDVPKLFSISPKYGCRIRSDSSKEIVRFIGRSFGESAVEV